MAVINSLKTLTLPILIMTLITGFAAAYWNEQLTITGNITTNYFEADLSLPMPLELWSGDNEVEKDIGYIDSVTISDDPNDEPDDITLDLITAAICNAYPSYEAWFTVGLHVYAGSMPGIVKEIIIDAPPELDVWVDPDWTGLQVHECEEYFFEVHVHVVEIEGVVEPAQDTTYDFTVTVVMAQYNAPPG